MVKLYSTTFTYDYGLPAVSLAYFLRYPNPYSTHVLSTDVIERFIDPATQRLHTTRLHLKKSRIPSAILRLLPAGIAGGNGSEGQSFILETSVVDIRSGWMETESRNMEWTGILSVIEQQRYTSSLPPSLPPSSFATAAPPSKSLSTTTTAAANNLAISSPQTHVASTVTFCSRFGQARALQRRAPLVAPEVMPAPEPVRRSFLATWSTAALQRTIEATGVQRARRAMANSTEGMNVVLARMQTGGLSAVLEGMRRDREGAGEG